jgi:hypothetical protein
MLISFNAHSMYAKRWAMSFNLGVPYEAAIDCIIEIGYAQEARKRS